MSSDSEALALNPAKEARGGFYLHPRYWRTWLLRLWMHVWARLPLGFALRVHEALGRVLYAIPSRARKIVKTNLRLSFPDMSDVDVDRLAKRHFAAMAAGFAECSVAWCGSDRHIEGRFKVDGLEHVQQALAGGKGVILFTGHFTGLEICGRHFNSCIERFVCMYSRRSNALMNEIQRRGRLRVAHESIASDQVRELLHALKRNCAVWYAPDQAPLGRASTAVSFFAEPAMMTTATTRIARISGAPVVPFFYRRVPGTSRYELRFEPPLQDFPGRDEVADTQRLAAQLEAFVRAAPAQYFWVQKKFRQRPGIADAY